MSKISLSLFSLTVLLCLVGLFLIYESSSYTALYYINDKYYFIKNQIIWVLVGIVFCLFLAKYDYRKLFNLSLPLLLMTFLLLLLVFAPVIGLELKGANRWIDIGFMVIQPSELLKISLTLYFAAWLSRKEKSRFWAFLMLFIISVFLVAVEPDLGTALIVAASSIAIYFLSGARIVEILSIIFVLAFSAFILIKVEPYRVARLASFQNFDINSASDSSYHVKQILISLGSGGLTGVGIGNSIQKYAYLPENTTDSIFAMFAEEVGFFGSVCLIFLLFLHLFLGFRISARTTNKFGRLLSAGIVVFIGVQTLINLASQVVLIPLVGVPLPFISYGGSSMIINFISVGILMNIGNRIK